MLAEKDLEQAARRFLSDVARLADEYEAESTKIDRRYKEAADDADRLKREAYAAYVGGAQELNGKYALLVATAANRHAESAEHPDIIRAAASTVDSLIGGAAKQRTEFPRDAARSKMLSEEKKRRDREKFIADNERMSRRNASGRGMRFL